LTIEYPANGSFSDHKNTKSADARKSEGGRAVCKELSRVADSHQLTAISKQLLRAEC